MTDGQVPPPLGQAHHFLVHIDHVGIHADDPAALFRFFAKDLGLPIAFPYATCARLQHQLGLLVTSFSVHPTVKGSNSAAIAARRATSVSAGRSTKT